LAWAASGFFPGDNYDHGDGDASNDDENDDDDDDDDEIEYQHRTMETRHDLEMDGNQGRHLVRAETN
jgi:hypothetical protein